MELLGATKKFDLGPIHRIYFLIKDGAIVYVGKSNNLPSRIGTHKKEKDFDAVRYLDVELKDQDDLEIALIKAIRPPLNLQSKSLKEISASEKSLIGRYMLEEEILKAAIRTQPPPEKYGTVAYLNYDDEICFGLYDNDADMDDEDHEPDCKFFLVEQV